MEQKIDRKLCVRLNRLGWAAKKVGKKYYKSIDESIAHIERSEKMDDGYLLNWKMKGGNIIQYNKNHKIGMMEQEAKADYLEHYKRGMPKNWSPFIDGLITFTETMQTDIMNIGIESLFEASKDFVVNEFGKSSLIGVSIHMDETTPHIHFTLINYNYDKKKSISGLLEAELEANGRVNGMQDRYEAFIKSRISGFDYQRGTVHAIKEYHEKRAKQEAHLKSQMDKNKALEKTNEALVEAIREKDAQIANMELSQASLTGLIEELGIESKKMIGVNYELYSEYQDIIEQMVDDMLQLNDDETATHNFLKLVMRYLKKGNAKNPSKLEALITKHQHFIGKAAFKETGIKVQKQKARIDDIVSSGRTM
jgi:hypothetical protein